MSVTQVWSRARGAARRRWALLGLAVAQVVAPVLSQRFGGTFTTADRAGEPPIVPPGWAFSIWGLVEVLSLGYAVWALPAHRPDPELRDRLARPLLVVFAGFTAWLAAAEIEPLWATVVVFLVMLGGLLRALQVALAEREAIGRWRPLPRALLWGTLGVYTGWSSVAVWLNLTTGLAGSGAPISGPAGTAGQLAILAGAAATAVALLRWTGGLLPYAAAVAWAFTGAIVGAADAGEPVLSGAAAVGLAVVLAATVAQRRAAPRAG
jgi:hypothetical protein